MADKKGVYTTKKKDGSTYYRVSLTYKRKHISLGSYNEEEIAQKVYEEGRLIIDSTDIKLENYSDNMLIPYNKFVCLINFRDNGIYFSTPIYLRKQYFEYHLSKNIMLKFDRDDLFFYASHTIQQKGGYLFISDYGSQYKILGRYGVKPFAVYERDYVMVNGDIYDYRYSNIKILNNYTGVLHKTDKNKDYYEAVIHIIGNYIVGHYDTEIQAAVAYNKAVDTLHARGITKNYTKNYIVSLKKEEYLDMYNKVKISDKIINYEK